MPNYIMVPVPDEMVPEVMELITKRTTVATDIQISPQRTWDDTLQQLWPQLDAPIKTFLKTLAKQMGQWVPTGDLLKPLGKSRSQIAGMLGAFGRRCRNHYNGKIPFDKTWDKASRQYTYRVPPSVAQILNKLP